MPTSPVSSLIGHIRRAVPSDGDGELLGRFVERRDDTALAALVKRHGPMVWGVCRRLLGHHDAEDAFQATFIVLVRKAASVKPREMVGNWLYGVARQAALQARTAARRRAREKQVAQMSDTEAPQDRWADVRPILDEELSRLPDHYRAVIVLCDLEGRTRKEVARQLGCAEGTVASRLARAREMLARRLAARGVALSGGVLAAVLSRSVASAGVPTSVVISTIKAANIGQGPVKVAALAEGVLKTMLLTKLKSVTAVLVVAALVGLIGYGVVMGKDDAPQKQESQPKIQKGKDAAVEEKAEKESIAWGKEVDGLQMGLTLEDAHTVRQGEKAKFAVRLRNVSKAEVTVTYGVLRDYAPQVTTDMGGPVSVYMPPPFDNYAAPMKRALRPGESITLYSPEVAVESEALMRLKGIMRVDTPTICVEPGKYTIAYGGIIQSHPKLKTGTVEFEVKDQVAWGKEVGGLQAGLLTDARTYRPGEKVKLEVKLRNVSNAPVTITFGILEESAPQLTDSKGGQVHVTMPPIDLFIPIPTERVLKPGELITLYKPEVAVETKLLGPVGPEPQVGTPTIRVEPGKYEIAYSGMVQSHPALSTGMVEFEVKEPVKPIAEIKDDVAWGNEVDALQMGLALTDAHTVRQGEKAKFAVKLRNVGKAEVSITYRMLQEHAPQVATDTGGRVSVYMPPPFDGLAVPINRTLKPGETITLYNPEVAVEPEDREKMLGEMRIDTPTICVAPGKYKIAYGGMLQSDPKLTTGTVEFEVKAAKE